MVMHEAYSYSAKISSQSCMCAHCAAHLLKIFLPTYLNNTYIMHACQWYIIWIPLIANELLPPVYALLILLCIIPRVHA